MERYLLPAGARVSERGGGYFSLTTTSWFEPVALGSRVGVLWQDRLEDMPSLAILAPETADALYSGALAAEAAAQQGDA